MKLTLLLLLAVCMASCQLASAAKPRPWKTTRCPHGGRFWRSCNECACPAGDVDCTRGDWAPCPRPYDKCPPLEMLQRGGACGETCTCDPKTLFTSCDAPCVKTLIENFYPWE